MISIMTTDKMQYAIHVPRTHWARFDLDMAISSLIDNQRFQEAGLIRSLWYNPMRKNHVHMTDHMCREANA